MVIRKASKKKKNKYKIIMILVKIAQNYFVLIFYNF